MLGRKKPPSTSNRNVALAAAAGLIVGLVTNALRKAAVQTPAILAGNWADSLAAEHKATLKLFDALQRTEDDQSTRRGLLLAQLKNAISKHSLQEESAVYPALRKYGFKEQTSDLNDEHALLKYNLFRLSEMNKKDPAWLPLIAELRSAIEPHMREEEEVIFPKLQTKLSAEESKRLTSAMHREGFKLA